MVTLFVRQVYIYGVKGDKKCKTGSKRSKSGKNGAKQRKGKNLVQGDQEGVKGM